MADCLEAGDIVAGQQIRREIEQTITQLRAIASETETVLGASVRRSAEHLERELARTRMQSLLTRAEELATDGRRFSDDGQTEVAFDALTNARELLERAQSIARENELGTPDSMQRTQREVDAAIDTLDDCVLETTTEATQAAIDADEYAVMVENFQTALDGYRELLQTVDRDEKTFAVLDADRIEFQIAWLLGRLVDARLRYAAELRHEGVKQQYSAEDPEKARKQYRAAREQLEVAKEHATGTPAGDIDEIQARIDSIADDIRATHWVWGDTDDDPA